MNEVVRRAIAADDVLGSVTLPAWVRVARTKMTASELAEVRSTGRLSATPTDRAELIVGDCVVATGRIVDGEFEVEELR